MLLGIGDFAGLSRLRPGLVSGLLTGVGVSVGIEYHGEDDSTVRD